MKILKKIVLLSLLLTVVFTSCSKDDDTDSDEIFIEYTANGVDYKYTDPASASSSNMTINGQIGGEITDADYSRISIWFPLQITTGTYEFSGNVFEDGDYKFKLISNPLNIDGWATSGSITISAINDEYFEGHFTAIVTEDTNNVNITDGKFRAYTMN